MTESKINYAKIGIRPVIDGRQGGVRESLEEKTMSLAHMAKKLIQENVFYADGKPLECVIASRTIGGRGDAGVVEDEFKTQNVVATLTVTASWCYGTEVLDMDPNTIKAIWGFNGTERPGAVFLAAALAGYAQRGMPVFSIYGHDVQDMEDTSIPEDVKRKILLFARGVNAVGQMRGKAYVSMGNSCMGIAGSQIDPVIMHDYFGLTTEYVDMTEILRRIKLEIYDKDEYEKCLAWIKENCKEGFDKNAGKDLEDIVTKSKVVPPDKDWEFIAKQSVIMRDIMFGNPKLHEIGWSEEARGRNGLVGGFQGQRQWTDWLPNCDFEEAIMNSTFDWNGARRPTAFATENDALNGLSMLLGTLITNKAPIFSDVRTYWSPEAVKRVTGKELTGKAKNGVIHLINSGATCLDATGAAKDENGNGVMKEFWNMSQKDIDACLKATDWCRADYQYFRGGGFSSHFKTSAQMPLTMIRLNLIKGVGPVIQIVEGYSVELQDDVHKALDDRTDKTWPTTWFAPIIGEKGCESVYDVMARWGANHGAIVYGHVGEELITLASMLRIPVSLHNIADSRIYRPHTAHGFGTKDLEASDYNFCKTYGPMYKA
ncbi:MAG: L-fucose isomerase [Eubacteriales bacterium]|nr:L-fucose isomerase [Eubacteriales bacterium]